MTKFVDRTVTLSIGVVIGIVIMIATATVSREGDVTQESVKSDDHMIDSPATADRNNEVSQVEIAVVNEPHSQEEDSGEPILSPIRMPEVYSNLIRERKQRKLIAFEDIHRIFENEQREEAWAGAMESGINHYISNTEHGKWGVVEYVECRSRMCEVAGYVENGEISQPRSIINDFLKSGLWQGQSITHSTNFADAGRDRFVIIVSGYSQTEYPSALSLL